MQFKPNRSVLALVAFLGACGGQEGERIITPTIIPNFTNQGDDSPPNTSTTFEEISSQGWFVEAEQTTIRIPDAYSGFCTDGQVTWSLERKNAAGESLPVTGISIIDETKCSPKVTITSQFPDDQTTRIAVTLDRPNDRDVLLRILAKKRHKAVIQFPAQLPANTIMSAAPGRPQDWPQDFRDRIELLYSASLYIPQGANYAIRDDQTWDLVMRTIYNGTSWTFRDGDRANTRIFSNIPGIITDPDGLSSELQVSGDCRILLMNDTSQVISNGCPLNFRFGRAGMPYRDQFQSGDTQFEISFRGQQQGGIFQLQNNFSRPSGALDGRYGLLEIFLVARNAAGETRKSMALMVFEIDS